MKKIFTIIPIISIILIFLTISISADKLVLYDKSDGILYNTRIRGVGSFADQPGCFSTEHYIKIEPNTTYYVYVVPYPINNNDHYALGLHYYTLDGGTYTHTSWEQYASSQFTNGLFTFSTSDLGDNVYVLLQVVLKDTETSISPSDLTTFEVYTDYTTPTPEPPTAPELFSNYLSAITSIIPDLTIIANKLYYANNALTLLGVLEVALVSSCCVFIIFKFIKPTRR